MTTKVKICGLRDEAGLEAALNAGADYVGFVFFPRSPRNIAPPMARVLADRARGRAKIVALLVDPDDQLLEEVVGAVDPDIIQLHGAESPARVGAVARRFGKPVMKAVAVADADDVTAALSYRGVAERILFDAKLLPSEGMDLPGGNGIAFDWQALAGLEDGLDFMLAGGLTPLNVAEAVRLTRAPAVDVSSGVETRPGEKDPELIRRFISAAKTANQTP
ncbi:N-(5'-phosphoribosyl)anthranilate isomerase [Hyphomicrobium sp. 1Nfss2.1]|uniref:phosphoribosylanthranilate isomerase n=1 Tax=Hyphomicrobium sp. 1Nfss2.1 TaxID=3413936 RepID=UPI003C7E5CF6